MKYYVSPSGRKEGTGSKDNPWSFQFAINSANGIIKGGDEVELLPGKYSPVLATAMYNDYVTFIGNDNVIIEGDSITTGGVIRIEGGQFYRFMNLHIYGNIESRDERIAPVNIISSGFDLQSGSNIDIIECHVENTTASGVYKSASCKDVNILNSIFRYNGYYSISKGRYAHHGLYIQNSEGSYCNIKRNIISHPMAYGAQVWHQSGPHKQKSKLIDVTFEDNIFIVHNETGLLYGGNNLSKGGVIENNSIYPINANGLRVGYDVLGNTSYVTDFFVKGNIVHGNIQIINPKPNPTEEENIMLINNIAVKPGYTFSIFTDEVDNLTKIMTDWKDNTFIASTASPFQWVNYNNINGRAVQDFNVTLSGEEMIHQGLSESNIISDKISNYIKYVTINPNTIYAAIHNFEEKDTIELDLNAYFEDKDAIEIFDVENMQEPIYAGESGKIIADMRALPQIEPIFGNIPTPEKSDDNFVALVIKRVSKDTTPKPNPDPISNVKIQKINIVNEKYRVFVDNCPAESYNISLSEAIEAAAYIKQTNPSKEVTIRLDEDEIRINLDKDN